MDFGARIANIAVVLLAYIAFIPSMRSVIPPVSYITLSDGVILLNLLACLVILLQSYLLDKYQYTADQQYQLTAYFFALTCVLLGAPVLFILVGFLLFYCKWQPAYNKRGEAIKRRGDEIVEGWHNPDIKKVAD